MLRKSFERQTVQSTLVLSSELDQLFDYLLLNRLIQDALF